MAKNPPANAGDTDSTPGSGRFPGEENGNPFQNSCLRNLMNRGAWWAAVHGVTESDDLAISLSLKIFVSVFEVKLLKKKIDDIKLGFLKNKLRDTENRLMVFQRWEQGGQGKRNG